MPGPVEPRLLKRAGATRNYLVASVLVGILTSGLVIAQAWLLARTVAIVLTYRALPGDWLPTLVLLLAPECYQPLRDVGAAYHQSEDGVAALRAAPLLF